MRERPVLFSDEMVRAILNGRKTQTRRLAEWPVHGVSDGRKRKVYSDPAEVNAALVSDSPSPHKRVVSPFGRPGDRLYVRECWGIAEDDFGCQHVTYRADDAHYLIGAEDDGKQFLIRNGVQPKPSEPDRWRPSIHMPRWASRLALEVTGVRIERLQDITEDDARAEGWVRRPEVSDDPEVHRDAAHDWFMDLWTDTYGRDSWDANPWVWVVSFRRLP